MRLTYFAFISDGIVRVDIMQAWDGYSFRVNEFESLEADFMYDNNFDYVNTLMDGFMTEYWSTVVNTVCSSEKMSVL